MFVIYWPRSEFASHIYTRLSPGVFVVPVYLIPLNLTVWGLCWRKFQSEFYVTRTSRFLLSFECQPSQGRLNACFFVLEAYVRLLDIHKRAVRASEGRLLPFQTAHVHMSRPCLGCGRKEFRAALRFVESLHSSGLRCGCIWLRDVHD